MDSGPDILVKSPDESTALLIVEVKLGGTRARDLLTPLKRLMLRMRSPVGLLVTGDAVTVLCDTFESDTEASINAVAEIPTLGIPELYRFAAGWATDPIAFEDAVQDWLVQLRNRLVHGYPSGADPILAEHVMPALAMGEIRAAGPRSVRSAAG
jgi:hypothetical protein